MSRLRTSHQPDGWLDLGPTGCNRSAKSTIGGAMVVGGPVTGPVMGFWRTNSAKTPEELAESKRQFVGHLTGKK